MTRTPKLIASAFLVLTLATACGGGDDGGDGKSTESKSEPSAESTKVHSENRPTVDELSALFLSGETMLGSEVQEEQADCIAEVFYGSDVSDEWLEALVAKDPDYQTNDADQKAMEAISEDWTVECMGAEPPAS